MADDFYTLITSTGKAKLAAAIAAGVSINITQMAVGDGTAAPSEIQTALVSEKYRQAINGIRIVPDNPAWVEIEGVIPQTVGGWYVREVGIFDDAGALIAVARYPESFKPQLDSGTGKDLYIRLILEVGNTSSVNLLIDPAIVLATRKYVDDTMADHENSHDHPYATTEMPGFVELSTMPEAKEGLDDRTAVTPKGLWTAINSVVQTGQCYLQLAGANLVLIPKNGDLMFVGGVPVHVPGTGVQLPPTGNAANTTYYIYAQADDGTLRLEKSTTAHTIDPSTGIEIKIGAPSRSLVGMARSDAAGNWADAQGNIGVLSWYQQQPRNSAAAQISSGVTLAANGQHQLAGTGSRNFFLCWAGAAVDLQVTCDASLNTINGLIVWMHLDGVGGKNAIMTNQTPNRLQQIVSDKATGLSEMQHLLEVYVASAAGTVMTIYHSYSDVTVQG